VKFGYILPNFGDKISPQELLQIAGVCEEEGYDSVWATDHIIMPAELREPYGQLLEPLTTLSFVAAGTTKLGLGTSVLVITQRNPILAAKQAATLDVFSGGRLILGLGAGWAEEEFGFLNMPFARRGKVFNESIRLMKALWSQDTVNFSGEFYKIQDAVFLPKPVRRDIPVWIGGNGPTAFRRAGALGDGWHPVGPALADFASGAEKIRDAKRRVVLSMRMTVDVRKKREELTTSRGERRTVISGTGAEIRKGIDGYADAGLEYFCASILHQSAEEIVADLRKFAREVIMSY
jgi:probable F420-dependent oxidoreductase